MNFQKTSKNGYTLVTVLANTLDTTNAPELKSELLLLTGKGEKYIVIDLAECEYADSSGLSALLVGNRLCDEIHGAFVVVNPQPEVLSLLEISMLDSVIKIKPTEEDAVELISSYQ